MTLYKTGYLSTAEVAKFFGISKVAVFKRIKKGQIKAVKIGRSYAIDESVIKPQFSLFPIFPKYHKEYVSVIEAAQILDVSRITIINKIKMGSIEAKKIGRHYVIDKSLFTKEQSQEFSYKEDLGKKYISAPELAKILRISRIAVFKKIKKGQIKARKVGRHYVIAQEDVFTGRESKVSASSEEYISVMEAAQHLGVSRIVVFKRIKEGKIKAIKIGRSYALKRADFGFFIEGKNKK